jgi:hypothetical protein
MYQSSVSAEPGSEPGETVEFDQTADSESADPRESAHAFRDELARAMHAAAEHERLRIEATVDEDATAHIEKVRLRAQAEAGELKRLAEDDVTGIRGWAKSEIERIRAEADVQINERRERLEQHLIGHATIIDGEVDRVSEAIEGYRHELAAFFVHLSDERDPTEIARLADTVPTPPDFEVIRAVARAEAVDRLSRLEDDEASSTEASAAEASSAEAGQESSADAGMAVPAGSAEGAGDAPEGDRELVAVMDPALASTGEEQAVEAGSAATFEAAEAAAAETAAAETAAAETSGTDEAGQGSDAGADVPVADMAATAGEPAEDDEAARTSEPVGVAAGSASDSNPAARFIRSITSWGSSDHGNGDQAK